MFLTKTAQGDVEMQPYGGGANPQAILEECREITRALDQLDAQLDQLDGVFKRSLARPDMPSGEINSLSSQIMTGYRGLVSRVKKIKSKPESGTPRNAPQVGMVDRRLKTLINRYQTLESEFRNQSQAAAERQYRIVRPDATDAEVREAVSDPDAPIFQQAVSILMLISGVTGRLLTSFPAPQLRPPRPSQLHPAQRQGAPRRHPKH
jgi:syntaxin 1B/2/3